MVALPAIAALTLIAWSGVECAIAWPNSLCFTNGLWSSRADGYKLLSDSNFDWGQGIPEMTRWSKAQQIPVIAIWYFGTDPDAQRPPFHSISLIGVSPAKIRSTAGCRYLAVSATILYGSYVDPAQTPALDWLRHRPIADRTRTFFIFDLDAADSEAKAVAARLD